MRNLLQFIIKHGTLLMFIALEGLAVVLLCSNNYFQRSIFFSSANHVTGEVFRITNNVTDYFSLRRENEMLNEQNAVLNEQIRCLENQLRTQNDSLLSITPTYLRASNNLSFIPAKVVNITTNQAHNYITIDKGRQDGIRADMGVINADGVIGIVSKASEHFAVVIPILNPKLAISTKFTKNNYSGTLRWDKRDYRFAQLQDIARHIDVEKGDTLVTSGYTNIFPEGIPVGTIERSSLSDSDDYHHIQVRLAVNFHTLGYVQVINNHLLDEQIKLETDSIPNNE